MIEAIMLKLGFSGMIAVVLAATLVGGSIATKIALARKDALLAKKTAQVQGLAYERDQLKNANTAFKQVVLSQNRSIENLMTQAEEQKKRVTVAQKEAQSVKDQWDAYLNHLNQPIGQGDRWELYKHTYEGASTKWNKPDTAPSEMP